MREDKRQISSLEHKSAVQMGIIPVMFTQIAIKLTIVPSEAGTQPGAEQAAPVLGH